MFCTETTSLSLVKSRTRATLHRARRSSRYDGGLPPLDRFRLSKLPETHAYRAETVLARCFFARRQSQVCERAASATAGTGPRRSISVHPKGIASRVTVSSVTFWQWRSISLTRVRAIPALVARSFCNNLASRRFARRLHASRRCNSVGSGLDRGPLGRGLTFVLTTCLRRSRRSRFGSSRSISVSPSACVRRVSVSSVMFAALASISATTPASEDAATARPCCESPAATRASRRLRAMVRRSSVGSLCGDDSPGA